MRKTHRVWFLGTSLVLWLGWGNGPRAQVKDIPTFRACLNDKLQGVQNPTVLDTVQCLPDKCSLMLTMSLSSDQKAGGIPIGTQPKCQLPKVVLTCGKPNDRFTVSYTLNADLGTHGTAMFLIELGTLENGKKLEQGLVNLSPNREAMAIPIALNDILSRDDGDNNSGSKTCLKCHGRANERNAQNPNDSANGGVLAKPLDPMGKFFGSDLKPFVIYPADPPNHPTEPRFAVTGLKEVCDCLVGGKAAEPNTYNTKNITFAIELCKKLNAKVAGGGAVPEGEGCIRARDCESAVCLGGTCQAPTCSDGVHNGTETDVDCGGGCGGCVADHTCLDPSDCLSGICSGSVCLAATCDNDVQDAVETDVDCGGACDPCVSGEDCALPIDCVSGVCASQACQPPTCTDGRPNGSETGLDCGGGSCSPCATWERCNGSSDCQSGLCASFRCLPATCANGVRDGSETGIDCGIDTCGPCSAGRGCIVPADCQSHVCSGSVCQAPTCADGAHNGNETDVDCGGGTCVPCVASDNCVFDTDCASGQCNDEATCLAAAGVPALSPWGILAMIVALAGAGAWLVRRRQATVRS